MTRLRSRYPTTGTLSKTPSKFLLAVEAGNRPVRLGIGLVHSDPSVEGLAPSINPSLIKDFDQKEIELDELASQTAQCLKERGLLWEQCAAILWGKGPGSFTGLRITATFFQTISASFLIPNFSIDVLMAFAQAGLMQQMSSSKNPQTMIGSRFIVIRQLTRSSVAAGIYLWDSLSSNFIVEEGPCSLSIEGIAAWLKLKMGPKTFGVVDSLDQTLLERHQEWPIPCMRAETLYPALLAAFVSLKKREIIESLMGQSEFTLDFTPLYTIGSQAWESPISGC